MEKIIIEILQDHFPNLKGVYLFGSRVNEEEIHQESDYDIAFLLEQPFDDNWKRFLISQELAKKLKAEVDLVDLQAANTVLRFQVVNYGKRIFTGDEYFCDYFDMTAMSMYQDFLFQRRDLFQAIKTRGQILKHE